MRSRRGPISLIIVGGLLVLGPLWGLLGTMIGMIHAFDAIKDTGQGSPERLASGISASLWATAVGLAMSPIGVALLVGGIIWIGRISKQEKASNQQIQAIATQRGSA